MGLFNNETLQELKDGLKNLGAKLKESLSENRNDSPESDSNNDTKSVRCPNCGAQLKPSTKAKMIKCDYCGTQVKNPNYTFSLFERDEDDEDK